MTILLSGGSKSGKSLFAQELTLRLADGGKRYYDSETVFSMRRFLRCVAPSGILRTRQA